MTPTLPSTLTETAADERTAAFLAGFETFEKERAGREPEAIRELRRRAAARLAEGGFPTPKDEEWRSTNVAPITKTAFHRVAAQEVASGERSLGMDAVRPWLFEDTAGRLTFVDGVFSAELSDLSELPEGVTALSLARALEEIPEQVAAHLGRQADVDAHPFVALSTAWAADGAYLHIPRGTVVESPIQLLFLATGEAGPDGRPSAAYFRNLVVADESSQATVVETYAGPAESRYFVCPVTEVVCGPNAVLDHYKLQRESTEAYHLATFELYQDRASSYALHSISLGGALVRNDVNTTLDAEGCESVLNGLYMLRGSQFCDHHMRVEHAKPHSNSFELFKGILEDRSRAVFNGLIHVFEDAQKTDAKQSNQNLLLSDQALVHSNPQLVIFADDVKCTHGSTVGQLDEDAVFYLRSRGIGREAAQSILTYAFAADIIERIRVPELRRELEEYLFARLPAGEVVREAV